MAISIAVLVPCFWHVHLEAGDLGSHLYNAWLAQSISRGEAPGLWLARQWNNVLFDWLLSGLGSLMGWHAAERVAVALAVLIFFWGAFALIAASARQAPWFFTPLLAAVAYGYTFEMGFFNYYLSIGFAFWGIAVFWRGRGWERGCVLPLAALAFLAHPLGFALLVAVAAYVTLAEWLGTGRRRGVLFFGAAAVLIGAHFYLARHFIMDPPDDQYWMFNGSDQLLLFAPRYWCVAGATLLVVTSAVIASFGAVWRERDTKRIAVREGLTRFAVAPELYALVAVGVWALPDGIRLPQYPAAVALLTQRLTSVSAVLLICVVAALPARRWHLAAAGAAAALFFGFLFHDTGRISAMETEAGRLVRTVPRHSRVMATIPASADSRIVIQHIIDRACISYCFSYGNYEPSSQQFRVRASPGNSYVMTDFNDPPAMEEGWYEVQPRDLPAWEVYFCDSSGGRRDAKLCIRALAEGEDVDDGAASELATK